MRSSLVRSLVVSGLALVSAHCGGSDPRPVTSLSTSAVPSGFTSSGPTDPASAAPVASASATPTAPVSPFTAVAPLPAAGRFFAVDGALLVAWSDPEAGGYAVRAIVDGALATELKLDLDIGTFNQLLGVSGSYPRSLVAIVVGDTGRTGIAQQFIQGKTGWTLKSGEEGLVFAGYARTKDALVALRAPSMPWANMRPALQAMRGSLGGRALLAVDTNLCKPDPENPFAPTTQLRPTLFGGTGAGSFFAFGERCDGASAVEVWPAGQKMSTVTAAPAGITPLEWHAARLATNDGDTAWAFGGEKVLFFDGKAWTTVDGAPAFTSGALAADGTLWAVVDRGPIYKGDARRGFEEVSVPGNPAVDDVGIASDGTVWISGGNALLRTGKPVAAPAAVDVAKASTGRGVKRKAPTKFGGPTCKSNVVVLYGFTKVTPDDYDFPLTRKALKGRTEFGKTRFVVTKDNGQKFFSALVPTFDEGKKLIAVIEKNVKGSRPQIVCAEPEVLRELKLDLATGEVAK